MNLMRHDHRDRPEPRRTAPGTLRPGADRASAGLLGAGLPQVSLEAALVAAFQVFEASPGGRFFPAGQFRRLLGHEQTSGNSVRLMVALQSYGLARQQEGRYTLTAEARRLFAAADPETFQHALHAAVMKPATMRELLSHGPDFSRQELGDDLKCRGLPDADRRTLLRVLQDNQELIAPGARSSALFGRFGRGAARPSGPGHRAGLGAAGGWLRSLPGRTASLTLAGVGFVCLLVAVAFQPELTAWTTPATRQAARPTPTGKTAGKRIGAPGRPSVGTAATPRASSMTAAATRRPTAHAASGTERPGGAVDPRAALEPPGPELQTAGMGTAVGQTLGRRWTMSALPDLTGHALASPSGRAAPVPASPAEVSAVRASADRASSPQSRSAQSQSAQSQSAQSQSAQSQSAQSQSAQTRLAQPHPRTALTPPEVVAETSRETEAPAVVQRPGASGDLARPAEPEPTQPAAGQEAASGPLQLGRKFAGLLYSQHLRALWRAFSPEVQQEWGTFAAFREYRLGGLDTYGAEARLVSEELRTSGDVTYYVRTATFERGPRHDWTLIIGLSPEGRVVGFNIVAAGVLPGLTASASR